MEESRCGVPTFGPLQRDFSFHPPAIAGGFFVSRERETAMNVPAHHLKTGLIVAVVMAIITAIWAAVFGLGLKEKQS
jgi:hypothetical protein